MAKRRRDPHWIEHMHMHMKQGAFSAEAKRAGESTEEYARENEDASGKKGRRARLAETLLAVRKR